MNPLLRRIQIVYPIFTNKIYKQWYNSQTKQRYFSQFINERPIPFKKMFEQPRSSQTDYSTDVNSKYRYWKKLSAKPNPQTSGLPFTLVSYNILAQDLLLQHIYLYRQSNQLYLRWSYRSARITEKIIQQKPDIICLQEVQENHLDDIMTSIRSQMPSMSCLFKKKTGPKSDGCAIIYNNKLFELILQDVVEFFRPDIQLLDRHNIALIAKFRCKARKEANFVVSTTHLLFNPRRQDVRLAQIMVLLAELDRHSIVKPGKLDRMPCIVTGDFNLQANSAPFQLITTGKLCYENLAKTSLSESGAYGLPLTGKNFISHQLRITDNCQHIDCVESDYKNCPQQIPIKDKHPNHSTLFATGTLSHELNLRSAYDHFDGMSYGSIFQNGWVTVDHIFYSKAKKKQRSPKNGTLQLLSVYQLPTMKQCRAIGILPNEEHGSDHLILAARFYLKFPIIE
ncbi:protein angel [Episyrphus balteatus]|uniref:protein angel n=1 Tax=Episyrphus balteatus TaxID=286459 RepID=UPI002485C4EA|nr:protein angel [Episyrphus balteatus]